MICSTTGAEAFVCLLYKFSCKQTDPLPCSVLFYHRVLKHEVKCFFFALMKILNYVCILRCLIHTECMEKLTKLDISYYISRLIYFWAYSHNWKRYINMSEARSSIDNNIFIRHSYCLLQAVERIGRESNILARISLLQNRYCTCHT